MATWRSPPARARGGSRRWGGHAAQGGALPGGGWVEPLQQFVGCQLDRLMPPLRRAIVAGDDPGAVDAAEVADHKRVSGFGLFARAVGQAEKPLRVFLSPVALQICIF